MSKAQVEEMINLAKSKNVFFMEAIWSRTFPLYAKVRSMLASGVIGDVS
jgi:dihydrodiol dehydrogenase / D-xylose 1-dehydrogenase (NADP)